MAKGANGTINPEFTQVTQQRSAIAARNTDNGIPLAKKVGISATNIDILFANSPLIQAQRQSGASDARDPDQLQVADGDIYKMYANVIDPTAGSDDINGFGFSGTEKAHLNYTHDNNPFIKEDAQGNESVDLGALVTGKQNEDTDASTRHYYGFPTPKPFSSLDTIPGVTTTHELISNNGTTGVTDLDKTAHQGFGSTRAQDRNAMNNNTSSVGADFGIYQDSFDPTAATNTVSDTLDKFSTIGQYFRNNYTQTP
jgi:hypothetical protein